MAWLPHELASAADSAYLHVKLNKLYQSGFSAAQHVIMLGFQNLPYLLT